MARERKKEETPSFLLVERVIESYFNKQLRNKYHNIKEDDTILKVETERLNLELLGNLQMNYMKK